MDDADLRPAVAALAAPRDAAPHAYADVIAAVHRRRRRQNLAVAGASVATIAAIAVGAVAVASPRPGDGTAAGHSVELTARGTPWGFHVEMTVSFPDSVDLVSGFFHVGAQQFKTSFYPDDGTDDGDYTRPLPLGAGVSVMVSAMVQPGCALPAEAPDLVVTSESHDSSPRRDLFTAANPDDYADALAAWCERGPQVTEHAASGGPDGHVAVTLQIVNPGTEPIHVQSHAYVLDGAHWSRAQVVVPAGQTRRLVVTASHAIFSARDKPWMTGHLTSDGVPLRLSAR